MESGAGNRCAEIDLQHRVLFDLLLRTHEAVSRGNRVGLGDALQQLRSYAGYHFSHEETWIRQHIWHATGVAPHAHRHAGFPAQLEALEAQWQQDELAQDSVLAFVGHWLVDHVARTDVPLIRSLLQQSATGPVTGTGG